MIGKRLIRRALFSLGYDLRKINAAASSEAGADMWTWLRTTGNIKSIIDIGANNGEFSEFLSTYFDAQVTVAIEPLPSQIALIKQRRNVIKNLIVHECAVSDHNSQAIFYEHSYSPASSLLKVSNISVDEFPQTLEVAQKINVDIRRLDDLIDQSILHNELLIKIDVQGLEDKVIQGGLDTFSKARFVLIEMSLVHMYDNQPLFEEVHEILVNADFRLAGIKNQINSTKNGQPLFLHCLYMRHDN
jgi:FkbM family methyltransferase